MPRLARPVGNLFFAAGALVKIMDLTKFNPTDARKITRIEQSPYAPHLLHGLEFKLQLSQHLAPHSHCLPTHVNLPQNVHPQSAHSNSKPSIMSTLHLSHLEFNAMKSLHEIGIRRLVYTFQDLHDWFIPTLNLQTFMGRLRGIPRNLN